MEKRLVRLLCLHGKYQSGEVLQRKLHKVESALNGVAELVYLDAPHEVTPQPVARKGASAQQSELNATRWRAPSSSRTMHRCNTPPKHRAWWHGSCQGWDESMVYLKDVLHTQGPFDGLVGFSQGGTVAGLLCTKLMQEELGYQPKVAIMCSGRRSMRHDEWYSGGVDPAVRTVHAIGVYDGITHPAKSRQLLQLFEDAAEGANGDGAGDLHLYEHEGGHVIPESEQFVALCREVVGALAEAEADETRR